MRALLAAGAALAMAATLSMFPVSRALACSCALTSEDDALAYADVVFEGEVTREPLWAWLWITNDASDVRYEFTVDDVIKGGPLPARIQLATAQSGASCGAEFAHGERWRVFASGAGDDLASGLCSGNRLLREGAMPPPASPIMFTTAMGAILLALFALWRAMTR